MTGDTDQLRRDVRDTDHNGLQSSRADIIGSGCAAQAEHRVGRRAERTYSGGSPGAGRSADRKDHRPGKARGVRTGHTCSHASAHDGPEMNAELTDAKSISAAQVNRRVTGTATTSERTRHANG